MQEEGTNEEIQLDESLFAEEQDTQEQEAQAPAPTPNPQQEKQEDDIPEKYRGKSAMEIIKMHQDAERLIGKQGNEVGELRKIVDDIVASTATQTSEKAPEPEPDFFEDPKGASARTAREVYESDTELKEFKESVKEMKREQAAQQLLRRHPDAVQLSNDPQFGAWVSKSQLRQNLFMQAHTNFDYSAAAELFDLYKDSKAYNKGVEEAATSQRKQSVKAASTGSGKASSESRGKPRLSREAIVNLRINDPERYAQLLPQLKQAYKEGRVT